MIIIIISMMMKKKKKTKKINQYKIKNLKKNYVNTHKTHTHTLKKNKN
jgi:hypothetical protein